jgi:hypothetical protein
MSSEQILNDLTCLLDYLNQQLDEIKSSHNKFSIALTGVLKIADGDALLLTKLQGNPENLKSYLLQMAMQISDLTTQSYENACKRIESIIKAIRIDRKS